MTLEEIWLTLTGRPDKAAKQPPDEQLETLNWTTGDSAEELQNRAEAAAKSRNNGSV